MFNSRVNGRTEIVLPERVDGMLEVRTAVFNAAFGELLKQPLQLTIELKSIGPVQMLLENDEQTWTQEVEQKQ